MEGKTMILSVLIMSLVMARIQVEAKSCCPSTTARNIYNGCRLLPCGARSTCASVSGCKIIDGKCPSGWQKDILENSDDAVNEYCKLGCVSSMCGAMNTLQNIDASEVVNGAVEKCATACSTFCTKGSTTRVETA